MKRRGIGGIGRAIGRYGRRRIAHDNAPTQRQQVGVCVLCPIFAGLPWARASEL
jgi:hypothetical protein